MATKTQQVTVTKQTRIGELVRTGQVTHPVDLLIGGKVVGRLVPPGELSDAEKEEILRKGLAFVKRARAHNKGVPEKEIAKVVDAAVKRVRAGRK